MRMDPRTQYALEEIGFYALALAVVTVAAVALLFEVEEGLEWVQISLVGLRKDSQ